jgi:hypothetical protein
MVQIERNRLKAEIKPEIENLLKKLLKNECQGNYKAWCAILLGMVGSYYSLVQAEPLLDVHRSIKMLVGQALEMLESKDTSNIPKEWLVGYYLNTTEQRISSTLDRLLKIYHEVDRGNVYELIRNIVSTCQHCGGIPDNAETRSILKEFLRKGEPKISEGKSLSKVWNRVNELKHEPSPSPDEEKAEERWNDACLGLSDLLQVFKDLASHRKLL